MRNATSPADVLSTKALTIFWILVAPVTALLWWSALLSFWHSGAEYAPLQLVCQGIPAVVLTVLLTVMTASYVAGRRRRGADDAPAEDPAPQQSTSAENAPIDAQVPATDCPCIRCGYNLRSLPRTGDCPECGIPISQTLEMVEAEFLCPNCLTPTHPSQPSCPHCKAPLTGSNSIAEYASGQIHAPPRISAAGQLRPAPLAPVILLWLIFGPLAIPTTLFWIGALRDLFREPSMGDFILWLLGGLVVLVLNLPLVLVTRAYLRRRRLPTGEEAETAAPAVTSPSEPEAP